MINNTINLMLQYLQKRIHSSSGLRSLISNLVVTSSFDSTTEWRVGESEKVANFVWRSDCAADDKLGMFFIACLNQLKAKQTNPVNYKHK